ncbi:hypothetical protein M9Y10_043451 [Tritrichomonas musculus]|uniref:Uncharacterized protein n=1 Tax=Tritrichomonas musculus TaxID=1915356 RepID=A0ABR2K1K7_9EUKA
MTYNFTPRSSPASPRSKSPPKRVSPYTPNSPKLRKSEIFIMPSPDFNLNPNFSLEKSSKAVANSLYNLSVGIETRLLVVLKQILDFKDCVPLEKHTFDKFVSLIDSAAACPSDCQYLLLTIPALMILYKKLIPPQHVLVQLIERAEHLLSPDNFFVTFGFHQLLPRYHIEEMILLFKSLLNEEIPDINEYVHSGGVFGSKYIEEFVQTGVIDEQQLQAEEDELRAKLRRDREIDLEKLKADQEKAEKKRIERQQALLKRLQEEKEEREREIREREERERLRREREEIEKEQDAIEKANRLKLLSKRAAKRKLAREKAEKEREEQERLEKERLEKEKAEKEEKEKREREARMMAIRKMAARKKAQQERAEREKAERERREKEIRERRELIEREEKEKGIIAKEAALKVSRERAQLEKEQLEKARLERQRLLKIAREKEEKEKEQMKAGELRRANSLTPSKIKNLLSPNEIDDDMPMTPKPRFKNNGEGQFNLDDDRKRRSNSLSLSNRNIALQLSPFHEKETTDNDDIYLTGSPTQDSEPKKEYHSISIQKFLSDNRTLPEKIKHGSSLSEKLDSKEREKLRKFAQLFYSWETAYQAVKEVWKIMKKDDQFEINILLSMMPVTFADYTVTGLKTFANDEGITLADIENMYDKILE